MPHFLIIDVEATCWDQRSEHLGENEIIEIGLALLSPDKELLLNEGCFVRPSVNPILSDCCKKLTSISQDDVDSAGYFPEVMKQFENKVSGLTKQPLRDLLFISWGNYDRNQFMHDCTLHSYPYPFGEHFNLKEAFRQKHGLKKAGLDAAMKFIKLPMQGTHHRGKDDALNISTIFKYFDRELT